jgi:hypothetical protein
MPPIILNGDTGIQTPMYNGSIAANAVTPSVNMKNRIINGAMTVSQYLGTSSATPVGDGYFIDRFRTVFTGSTKFTNGQNLNSVTPPTGFINYAGLQVATAGSISAGDINTFVQYIEGLNVSDLAWGTANAKTVTLSFWARSNITGTFGGSLQNSAFNRSYPFTYSIPVANTWTQINVTIAGDTSGTWLTTNGVGIRVTFSLGTGSTYSGTAGAWAGSDFRSATGATSIMASTSNVFYITGVQLEVGTQATSFDYRPYGTELNLCQRYCNVIRPNVAANGLFSGMWFTSSGTLSAYSFPVQMRSAPTLTTSAVGDFQVVSSAGVDAASVVALSGAGVAGCRMDITSSVSRTAGQATIIQTTNTSSTLTYSAEL